MLSNLKIKVGSEAESREAQDLFFELGYMVVNNMDCEKGYIVASKNAESPINFNYYCCVTSIITLPELRDRVVLKRNDSSDANVCQDGEITCLYDLYLTSSNDLYFYHCDKNKWILSNLNGDEDYYKLLKPIEKKESLNDKVASAEVYRKAEVLPFIDDEPKSKGMKFDSNKPRFSLLPKGCVNAVIDVLEFGAKKYEKDNWQQVDNAKERYYNAAMRHIDLWWNGEKIDSETGIHHLAHAATNLFFLKWFDENA